MLDYVPFNLDNRFLINFITDISRPYATKTTRVIRNIRSIRRDKLVEAIKNYEPVASDGEYGISVDQSTSSANTRKLFAVVDEITGDKKSTGAILPKHNDPQQMAQDLSDFFYGKISKLRDTFHDVTKPSLPPCPPSHSFSNFKPITRDDATKRISAMHSKSSALDPMPTQLVKLCLPELVDDLVNIANTSFEAGTVPRRHKRALVRP
ncbi:putative RNA-directed DNA polymerase from mobile element jockey-like [Apostichopus japonicus]|uniref:Putative RNA-directed DNA polymerase from mobile element jockey-like n=1 Tax=Stichopus japonicus TaxID=307972 RepID=A0A2G8KGS4_STIJA|nr:putative RNA-directed DNA polymerase from mobile element jockey-like [Apostichopus japonicus]